MSIKQGTTDIVDRYVGRNLIERVYQGSDLVFDPYTTLTGTLPLSFNSSVPGALKDYCFYGTSAGAGVATESGEPAGYKIPIFLSDGANISNYDLFIGSTKLGATEYLNFAEQKIYKDVSGTLTPTDPPAPLPAINAHQGENTLSSTETAGNVAVKGRIAPMYRQVEYLKSTGTQVIDTDIPIDSFDEIIDIDVQFGSALFYSGISDVNRAICGTSNPMFVAYCKPASVEFYLGYGWSSSLQTSTYIIQNPSYSSRNHLVLKRGGSTWGSSSVPANATISQTIPGLYALAFFGGKTSNGVIGAYKVLEASIYGVKIYDSSNNVVHDIVPAERYDGVLGLYDKSTAKFYTNVGEGEFVKGGYVI